VTETEFVRLLICLSIPYAAVGGTIALVADDVDRGKPVSGGRAARMASESVLLLTAGFVAWRFGDGWWILAAPVVWYRLPRCSRTMIGTAVFIVYLLWWNWGSFLN
jgi:hypothetical protein